MTNDELMQQQMQFQQMNNIMMQNQMIQSGILQQRQAAEQAEYLRILEEQQKDRKR